MKFRHVTASTDLHTILINMYPQYDVHVVAVDKLHEVKPKVKQIIIVNFQEFNQIGSHWVLVFCKSLAHVEYFDSFGLPPPDPVLNFMRQYKDRGLVENIIMTTTKVQKPKETICGWYILRYIHHRIQENKEPWMAVHNLNYADTIRHGKQMTKLYLRG